MAEISFLIFKRGLRRFQYLTFLQPDLIRFVELWQQQLTDSEIVFDATSITSPEQVAQFPPEYLIRMLHARGYYKDTVHEEDDRRYPLELTIDQRWGVLSFDKEKDKDQKHLPEAVKTVITLLQKQQNKTGVFIQTISLTLYFTIILAVFNASHLMKKADLPEFFTLLIPFTCISLFLGVGVYLLLRKLMMLFHCQQTNFLVPGVIKAARAYGLREILVQIVTGIVLLVILFFLCGFALKLTHL